MIYVRSRRPIVTLGASGLAFALLFAVLAAGALRLPGGWVASVALAAFLVACILVLPQRAGRHPGAGLAGPSPS